MARELGSIVGGRPYPVKDPVNPWGIPVPLVPPVAPWQEGTRQQAGSLGSGTNEQEIGTLSYFGHLKVIKDANLIILWNLS